MVRQFFPLLSYIVVFDIVSPTTTRTHTHTFTHFHTQLQQTLPLLPKMTAAARWTVQKDWREVVRDFKKGALADRAAARFWVSVYPAKDSPFPSIHGSVQLALASAAGGGGGGGGSVGGADRETTRVTMDGGKEFRVEAVSVRSFDDGVPPSSACRTAHLVSV